MKLELINGRPAIRFPNGEFATLAVDATRSSSGLLASLGGGGSLITQPLIGGTDGNLVVVTGPGTVTDADPLMKSRLGAEPLLLKVKRGEYHRLSGVLPLPITAAEAIRDAEGRAGTVVLAPRVGGRNWRIYRGPVPADLDPSLNPQIIYYEVGSVWGEGLLYAAPYRAPADSSADVPITRFYESFQGVPDGAAPPPELLQERWQTQGQTLAFDSVTGTLKGTVTAAYRRALAYMPAGQFVDGRVRGVSSLHGSLSGREIRVELGVSGAGNAAAPNAAGTETAWIGQLLANGNLSIYRYVNGVVTGGSALTVISGGLALDRAYAVELDRSQNGTVLRARAYPWGEAAPDWQRTTTSSAITGPGYAAVANHGNGGGGRSTYHHVAVTVGAGELAS